MNEIEAISVLETRIKYPNSDTYGGMCEAEYQQEAVVLAIEALREQARAGRKGALTVTTHAARRVVILDGLLKYVSVVKIKTSISPVHFCQFCRQADWR